MNRSASPKYQGQLSLILIIALCFMPSCSRDKKPFPLKEQQEQPADSVEKKPGRDNDQLWKYHTDSNISQSIVANEQYACIGTYAGDVYALNLEHGNVKWKFRAGEIITASPVFSDSTVLAGDFFGYLHALDQKNGQLKWRFDVIGSVLGITSFLYKGKRYIAISSYDYNVYCLDDKGKLLWKLQTGDYLNAPPVVCGDTLVIGGCDGYMRAVTIEDGKEIMSVDLKNQIPGKIIISENDAYAATIDGVLYRVQIPSGNIVWTQKSDNNELFMKSPAINDQLVVVGGSFGTLFCVDRDSGKRPKSPVRPFVAEKGIECPMTLRGKYAIFGCNDGRVYIVNVETGDRVWARRIGGEILAAPAIVNDRIITGSTSGDVYCFRIPKELE